MAIRWTGKLSDEVFDTIDKYNNKIKRLEKLGGYVTPNKTSFKEIKELVNNRRDLERVLKSLKAYNVRGAEKTITLDSGAKISRYSYDLARKNQRIAKMKTTRRLNVLKNTIPTEYGVKSNYNLANMGDESIRNLEARLNKLNRNITNINPSDLNSYTKYLTETSFIDYNLRDRNFMSAYFNEMTFNLGFAIGFDKDKINEMKDKIYDRLTDRQIATMLRSEEAFKSLRDWYNNIHRRAGLNIGNLNLINAEFNELYENLDDIISTYEEM